jgi:hypothetical protein
MGERPVETERQRWSAAHVISVMNPPPRVLEISKPADASFLWIRCVRSRTGRRPAGRGARPPAARATLPVAAGLLLTVLGRYTNRTPMVSRQPCLTTCSSLWTYPRAACATITAKTPTTSSRLSALWTRHGGAWARQPTSMPTATCGTPRQGRLRLGSYRAAFKVCADLVLAADYVNFSQFA